VEVTGKARASTPRASSPREADPVESPSPHLIAQVEALLISVDRPLPANRIAEAVGLIPPSDEKIARNDDAASDGAQKTTPASATRLVENAVKALNEQYVAGSRAFRVESLAAGYRVMTLPAFAGVVASFHQARQSSRLSRPAIETLAIIAYKQPVTRAELESIRGVSCGEVLKSLLERRLITIRGRAEELGRPMLYGTTRQFLDLFGLESIKDLPAPTDMKL
jgi:segregation and condensation protein B